MFKIKKIPALIITLSVLFAGVTGFASCKSDPDKGRTPYSPRSGAYTLMLKPEWQIMDSENINTLTLINSELNNNMAVTLKIDAYSKKDVANLNVSDVDSFINFYKTFDYVKGIYENDKNTVSDAVAIGAKDLKNTKIISGKRQEIHIKNEENSANPNSTSEFIYLETDKYYFAVSYGMPDDKLTDDVKNSINDAVFHIRDN